LFGGGTYKRNTRRANRKRGNRNGVDLQEELTQTKKKKKKNGITDEWSHPWCRREKGLVILLCERMWKGKGVEKEEGIQKSLCRGGNQREFLSLNNVERGGKRVKKL